MVRELGIPWEVFGSKILRPVFKQKLTFTELKILTRFIQNSITNASKQALNWTYKACKPTKARKKLQNNNHYHNFLKQNTTYVPYS